MSAIQQVLLALGSSPLDGFTANLWAGFSINRLLSNYSGNVIRVRRSSDSTEQDFGLIGNFLDSASIVTFCGAGDGFVTKVYDQGGTAKFLEQATTTKQPKIVASGVYLADIQFDGTDDCMTSDTASGTGTAVSVFIRGKIRTLAATNVYLETTADGVVNAGFLAYATSANTATVNYMGVSANRVGDTYNATFINDTCHGYRGDRSQAAKADQLRMWVNGVSQSASSSDNGASPTTANFASAVWNVGSRSNGTSLPTTLNLRSLVIYEVAKSDADMAAISRLV